MSSSALSFICTMLQAITMLPNNNKYKEYQTIETQPILGMHDDDTNNQHDHAEQSTRRNMMLGIVSLIAASFMLVTGNHIVSTNSALQSTTAALQNHQAMHNKITADFAALKLSAQVSAVRVEGFPLLGLSLKDGEMCAANGDCASKDCVAKPHAFCKGDGLMANGGACTLSIQCSDGLFCNDDKCTDKLQKRALCDFRRADECASGLQCPGEYENCGWMTDGSGLQCFPRRCRSPDDVDELSLFDPPIDWSSLLKPKPVPVPPTPKPAATGLANFDFTPFMDSPSGDLRKSSGGNVDEYAEECNKDIDCLGFNSNGWMKNQIADKSKWIKWTSNQSLGFYLKK